MALIVFPPSQDKTSQGWRRWQEEMKSRFPVRRFLVEIVVPDVFRAIKRAASNAVWMLRHRTTDRFHVIKMPTLEPGYHEYSDRMLHGCFALLTDYVEVAVASRIGECTRENGERWLEQASRGHPDTDDFYNEVLYLYRWWKDERPQRIDPWLDDGIWWWKGTDDAAFWANVNSNSSEYRTSVEQATLLEDLHNREDQEMLARLIAIRPNIVS